MNTQYDEHGFPLGIALIGRGYAETPARHPSEQPAPAVYVEPPEELHLPGEIESGASTLSAQDR